MALGSKLVSRKSLGDLLRALGFAYTVNPPIFIARFVYKIFNGLVPVINAYLAGQIINQVVELLGGNGGSVAGVVNLTIIVAVISLADQNLGLVDDYFDSKLSTQFDQKIQIQLMEQFYLLDHTYYEDGEFNKHLAKVDENRFAIWQFSNNAFQLFTTTTTLIAALISIFTLNVWVLIILFATLVPNAAINSKMNFARWTRWDRVGDNYRLMNRVRSLLLDNQFIKEVKILNLFNFLKSFWTKNFETARKSEIVLQAKQAKYVSAANVLEFGARLGVDIWLLFRVLAKTGFGLGDFQFYRQVIGSFSSASTTFLTRLQLLEDNQRYISDFFALMEYRPRILTPEHGHKLPSKSVPKIEVKDISFRYPNTSRYIFKNFTMTIEPGEAVAIVGENGAGKSTLIKLLMRFYDVEDGAILIDGKNIKDLDLGSWYEHVGVLFQDFNKYAFLSIGDNIEIGRIKSAGDNERLEKAMVKADAQGFIKALPKGLGQVLDKSYKEGIDISGGQWQRVALARAFFRQANILILDEPTSAIDAKAEHEIFRNIAKGDAGKTKIIISHRFSTVRNADQIYVMDGGKLIEWGTHESLMLLADGIYKKMFELQAEGYR